MNTLTWEKTNIRLLPFGRKSKFALASFLAFDALTPVYQVLGLGLPDRYVISQVVNSKQVRLRVHYTDMYSLM